MKFQTVIRSIFLLVSLGVATGVAAQSTKQRLQMLEQEVTRLERMLENGQSVQTDMLQTIRALEKENQELRNQLETLQFESGRSADRQRQLYLDLDQRLQTLESGRGSGSMAAAAAPGETPVDDTAAYQAAFDQLKAGNYKEAEEGFTRFLAEFTTSDLRDNAQYWLAETKYVQKDFTAALQGFQTVISDYPSSRKLPDAWLKVGYCNFELGKLDEARRALNTVISRYPESTAAKLAGERIALMDSAG